MTLKGKRLGCLLLLSEIIIIVLLSAYLIADGSSTCNIEGYTGGEGTWQIDPADDWCWYLHTNAEFDSGFDGCVACHDGIQAHNWYEE